MFATKLKTRHRIFAEKVASGTTPTDAYVEAGYRPNARQNVHSASWRLTQHPAVAAYIHELRTAAAERSRAETLLTIEDKLAFLARTIKTGAGSVDPHHPLCQSFRRYSDGSISVRTPDKIQALKLHTELSGELDQKNAPPRDTLQELFDEIRKGNSWREA